MLLHRRRLACGVLAPALWLGVPAKAAHPLMTEDTGTQGAGNHELENGLSWTRQRRDRLFVYQPQWSYGATAALDLIVQASWLNQRPAGAPAAHGDGDTALDVKWRFDGSAPLSLALRAGLLLPTSQAGLGMPRGSISPHGVLVATLDRAPWTLHGNLGYARAPAAPDTRRHLGHASAAATYALDSRWMLSVDAAIDTQPDATARPWQGAVLTAVICTVRPGLDIDLGVQRSLHVPVASQQWLLGVTYRWAR